MGKKIRIYDGIKAVVDEDEITEKMQRTVGNHLILNLKLKDGRKLASVDGLFIEPKDYDNLESKVKDLLYDRFSKSPTTFKEAMAYLLEKLPGLAATEGEKWLVEAYKDGIRTYTHKTIAELLIDASISGIPSGAGETKYWVRPGGAGTG
jgi:hypothetical protein